MGGFVGSMDGLLLQLRIRLVAGDVNAKVVLQKVLQSALRLLCLLISTMH